MDVLLSFPTLVMGLLVVAMLGPTVGNLILAITLTALAPFARIARAPTLSVKERDFIEAGRALGFSNVRLMAVHILPNVLDDILVMDKGQLEEYFMEFARFVDDAPAHPYAIRVGSKTLFSDDTMELRREFEAHVRKLKRRVANEASKK